MYTKPKKRLGQNFLVDKNIQRKIIWVCEFKASDTVLEMGAGRGELTRLIADKVARVYAIEIDPYLCNFLKDNFKEYKNIKIINQDILKFNLNNYLNKARIKAKVKIIGNIPYYITTPIIEYLIKFKNKIESIYITVQKEVAQRMIAQAGSKDFGAFSCFVQYYAQPEILFFIKKTCFWPQPKVDSAFMRLKIRKSPYVETKDDKYLFKIIRAAFNQKRKILRNSLKGIVPLEKLGLFFSKYNIRPDIRPEDLTLQDVANLSNL